MSDRIHTDAEREAKLIIDDATQKAEILVQDARNSLKKIYEEVADLQKVRMQFENNLRALIQSHMTMLEQGQKILPSPTVQEALPQEPTSEEELIKENIHRVIDGAAKNMDIV